MKYDGRFYQMEKIKQEERELEGLSPPLYFSHTLGDYDRWYKKCENCGYDPGKSNENRCWKCGRLVHRDFSERALKPEIKEAQQRSKQKTEPRTP